MEMDQTKTCARCRVEKPVEEFSFRKSVKGGRAYTCKQCNNALARARYQPMAERGRNEARAERRRNHRQQQRNEIASYFRAYRASHRVQFRVYTSRRRKLVRQAEGKFTAQDIDALYITQDGRCAYCKIPLGDSYEVDHCIPLTRGGSNAPENLSLACPSCNRRKWMRTADEFAHILAKG
jgi:5-methylcytosine-specific restriction endonuclease McrA